MSSTPLPDKVVAIDRALAGAGIPHAFGDALALAYYAEPRATIDIDVNLFVGTERAVSVRTTLESLGVESGGGLDALERDDQVRWRWERTPIDLFFAYHPFHESMPESVRRVPFGDDRIPILGPEHLTVCKAVFDRPKDWLDIEQILVSTPDLDGDGVRAWLIELMGESDSRLLRFDELARRSAG